jgi:hypothetical protein
MSSTDSYTIATWFGSYAGCSSKYVPSSFRG